MAQERARDRVEEPGVPAACQHKLELVVFWSCLEGIGGSGVNQSALLDFIRLVSAIGPNQESFSLLPPLHRVTRTPKLSLAWLLYGFQRKASLCIQGPLWLQFTDDRNSALIYPTLLHI